MKRSFPLLCITLLAGCAAQTSSRYPSLLPRPIESRSDAEPMAPPPAAATADPAMDQQIAGFAKTLADTKAAFAPAADRAERAARAAKGDKVGGERWIAAQTALSDLDAYRATTSSTLTDIEQVAIARAAADQVEYPGLEALRSSAAAMLDAQTARIAAIQAMLPQA